MYCYSQPASCSISLLVLPKPWAGGAQPLLTRACVMAEPSVRKVHTSNQKITTSLSVVVTAMLMKTGLESILDAKQIKRYATI